MKRVLAVLTGLLALAWWIRREPIATAYLDDVQRDDYLWSVLSGGEER